MRRDVAAQGVSEASVKVEFEVTFSRGPRGKRRIVAPIPAPTTTEVGPLRAIESRLAPSVSTLKVTTPDGTVPGARPAPGSPQVPTNIPKITLLLVVGHHFERLVREGVVKDYAEIARRTGLTRARVTQIVDLMLLAPEIQEQILSSGFVDDVRERTLRGSAPTPSWEAQLLTPLRFRGSSSVGSK